MARYAELVRYGIVAHDDGSDRMEPVAHGQWVRADEAAAAITALEADVTEARAQVDEHDQLFELQWKADMRAIEWWRLSHPGNELVMPDGARLTLWLLEQLTLAHAALKPFAEYAPYVEMFVEGRAKFGGSPVLPTKHFRKADFVRAREARASIEAKP